MRAQDKGIVLGLVVGLAYGLVLRVAGNVPPEERGLIEIMSAGFILFGPICIGIITVWMMNKTDLSLGRAFLAPFLPIILGCLVTFICKIEGGICIALYLPLGLVLAGLGGLVAQILLGRRPRRMMVAVAFVPFLSSAVEERWDPGAHEHAVLSEIAIEASSADVWHEIKSVRKIEQDELRDSWVHWIGFPRPLDAEISGEGVGAVRLARFERGLVFVETVNAWEPERELAFRIDLRDGKVPAEALDEHVTIGGRYFDVLDGAYRIVADEVSGTSAASDGRHGSNGSKLILRLESRFRLSTSFNWYSALWTSLIMQRMQQDILGVIKLRAEARESTLQ